MQLFDPKDQNFRTIQVTYPIAPVPVLIWTAYPIQVPAPGIFGKKVPQQARNPNQLNDKRGSGWCESGGRASATEDVGSQTKI